LLDEIKILPELKVGLERLLCNVKREYQPNLYKHLINFSNAQAEKELNNYIAHYPAIHCNSEFKHIPRKNKTVTVPTPAIPTINNINPTTLTTITPQQLPPTMKYSTPILPPQIQNNTNQNIPRQMYQQPKNNISCSITINQETININSNQMRLLLERINNCADMMDLSSLISRNLKLD